MERKNLLIIAIAGIIAVVVGLSVATVLGLDLGFLQGAIYNFGRSPP